MAGSIREMSSEMGDNHGNFDLFRLDSSVRIKTRTRRNSSLQNLVLLYLFLLKVNKKRGYNVTFLEITILNIKLWSY